MEIVLGAGSLSGDHMGSLRDLLGMPDDFYYKVYEGLHDKVSWQPKNTTKIKLTH